VSQRIVIPELLDHLPADDPEALRSRRDLRRINFLMGNERWVCRMVGEHAGSARKGIVEIGAGDGILCGKLARRLPQAPVSAYDLAPRPVKLEQRVRWNQGDIFDAEAPTADGVLVANLFLHHFEGESLKQLGRWVHHFEVLVFCEPDRARLPHILGRLMHPWINRVTRHDMHVSITAGFTRGEISRSMRLESGRWQSRESSTWRGARRVVFWRR
jgi:2-polyprenyl-3-methyl-5-hydroxy-6-metoxy-1,4-benzoquinol methylase